MKKRYWAFLIGSWCLSVGMQAAKVDTLSVHSDAMNKEVQVITICPDKAMAGEKCPVLYLLHGYGGNAGTWLGIKPELPRIADKEATAERYVRLSGREEQLVLGQPFEQGVPL